MTKVNFINCNEKPSSLFEDLEMGEYFFEDSEANNSLYIKLPCVIIPDGVMLSYNAYNLSTKSLMLIGDTIRCIPVKEIDICIKQRGIL